MNVKPRGRRCFPNDNFFLKRFLEENKNAVPLPDASSCNPGLLASTLFSIRSLPADQTLMILKESDSIGENSVVQHRGT